MRNTMISFSSFTLILVGCVGTFNRLPLLNPEAAHVEVVTEADASCETLGEVSAQARCETNAEAAMEAAQNDLRNQGYMLGASHIVIQSTEQDRAVGMWSRSHEIELLGTAYRCQGQVEESETPAPEAPSVQTTPIPEMSESHVSGTPEEG